MLNGNVHIFQGASDLKRMFKVTHELLFFRTRVHVKMLMFSVLSCHSVNSVMLDTHTNKRKKALHI